MGSTVKAYGAKVKRHGGKGESLWGPRAKSREDGLTMRFWTGNDLFLGLLFCVITSKGESLWGVATSAALLNHER